MTEEQILKRLAEIEGWESDERKGGIVYYDSCGDAVDPINDPGAWAPLIEKYRLQIEPPSKFEEDCFSIRELWTVCAYDSNDGTKSESLPHAICLAIIEANGGMGDE